MRKVGVLMLMGCFASIAPLAHADGWQCLWRNGPTVLLEIRTDGVLGLNAVKGTLAQGLPGPCTNALCLPEQRPVVLQGVVDFNRPIFDRATGVAIYAGQVLYRSKIADLNIAVSLDFAKIVFSDGSPEETFAPLVGCFIYREPTLM